MKIAFYDRDYNENKESANKRKEKLKNIAEEKNIKISKEYLDYNKEEKGFQLKKLLEDVGNKKIEMVLFTSLDRISRNDIEALKVVEAIEKKGTKCLFFENGLREIYDFEKKYITLQKKYMERRMAEEKFVRLNHNTINLESFSKYKGVALRVGDIVGSLNIKNILTINEENIGSSFKDFSDEQLSANVIPKDIRKNENNELEVIVDFKTNDDEYLFYDRLREFQDEEEF